LGRRLLGEEAPLPKKEVSIVEKRMSFPKDKAIHNVYESNCEDSIFIIFFHCKY
jgi:hypothetical protein